MARLKLIDAGCLIGICSFLAGATPIATSEISADLSGMFISVGAGVINNSEATTFSDLYAEDGSTIQPDYLMGDGNLTVVASGASASVSVGSTVVNISQATTEQGAVVAHTTTTSDLVFFVENVDVVNLSLDVSASLNLSTDVPLEYVYGYWDDYFALSYFDGTSQVLLDQQQFFFDGEAFGGDGLLENQGTTLSLTYNFGNTPFSGQLLVQNITQTWAEAQSSAPASVPEPSGISLMVAGLVMLLPFVKRRKE